MNTQKYIFFTIDSDSRNKQSSLNHLNSVIIQPKISPYSNKSEQQRLDELRKKVAEAKAALDTFSYHEPPQLILKFKKLFLG